jgi:putative ABC transport system permease protein
MCLDHAAITSFTAMLMRDLRYAVRTLLRNPGFTLVATGSLALAIGGSMAVFTLLNAVVLRSLPVYEPDRVFQARCA